MVILGWCLSSKTMVRLRSVIYRYNASHSPLYILSFGTVGVENVIKKSAKALFKTKGLIQNSTLN